MRIVAIYLILIIAFPVDACIWVKGTTQMAGDNGKLGVTYTIGASGPLNITLDSAEFSVWPVIVGDLGLLFGAGLASTVQHFAAGMMIDN